MSDIFFPQKDAIQPATPNLTTLAEFLKSLDDATLSHILGASKVDKIPEARVAMHHQREEDGTRHLLKGEGGYEGNEKVIDEGQSIEGDGKAVGNELIAIE